MLLKNIPNSAIQKLIEDSEAMKDKYIDVLEENRELRKRIETLEAELLGKSPSQGRQKAN